MTKQTGSGSTILIIVLAVLALGALGWAVYNQSLVDNLKRELKQTQEQLVQVTEETEEARREVTEELMEGAQSVGQAIQGINDPQLRLSLFQAYATKLKVLLTPASQTELDKVVVYVEKQPIVLVQPQEQWPAEIQAAVAAIKQEVSQAKTKAVASTKLDTIEAPTPAVGKTVTLTGTLEYVQTDAVTGAGLFKLTNESDGQEYYFQFNAANTATYQETMVGQTVTITINTTGTENGYVTYDVVSGPTLAVTTPTVKPTATTEE